MKYPGSIAGSIAASAPILAFPGMTPPYDSNSYWQVVTRDATPDAGATKGCDSNVRAAFSALWNLGASESGRAQLQSSFKVCKTTPVTTANDVQRLAFMMLNAWDTMAMGVRPPLEFCTSPTSTKLRSCRRRTFPLLRTTWFSNKRETLPSRCRHFLSASRANL